MILQLDQISQANRIIIMIASFSHKSKYGFLSNFYLVDLNIDNKYYPSVEHYYQSCKASNIKEHEYIRSAHSPSEAKRRGMFIELRKDWEEVKYDIMYKALIEKFSDRILSKKLLETKKEYIEEGNYWHDNIWGNCYCPKCAKVNGENALGFLLMKVRRKLKKDK